MDYAGVASVCREIIYNLVKMVEHRACNQKVDQCCQREVRAALEASRGGDGCVHR